MISLPFYLSYVLDTTFFPIQAILQDVCRDCRQREDPGPRGILDTRKGGYQEGGVK